jgi:hypothetical protein
MIYLFLIVLSIALFGGFLGLTVVEARSGTRVLSAPRAMLDRRLTRWVFIIHHVEWAEFFSHLIQSVAARVAHDVAHVSLIVVRFLERQLTRVVRYLRDSRPNLLAPKPSRSSIFTQTSNYLQEKLRFSGRRPKARQDGE